MQGRDWMSLRAAGARATARPRPAARRCRIARQGATCREFQLNLDGQQVTGQLGPGGQPRFSRDSIAEFQFISNRFDATQGRSSGVQVNAITKSGSNLTTGMFSGYFRNSQWSAPDPVLNRVVPLKNQQYARRSADRSSRIVSTISASYEYEHEPRTTFSNTAWPTFNIALSGVKSVKLASVRLDYELSAKSRLMLKGNLDEVVAAVRRSRRQPSRRHRHDRSVHRRPRRPVDARDRQRARPTRSSWDTPGSASRTRTSRRGPHHWRAADGINTGSPRITFTGFSIAGNANYPRYQLQDVWSARDDYNLSYDAKGRHDLKAGGEYLWDKKVSFNCANCMGIIDARQGAVPANIESLFPDPWNADTWNLAAISPNVRTYTIGVGQNKLPFNEPSLRRVGAGRLAPDAEADAQPRRALRLDLGSVRELGRPRAVDEGEPPAGCEQHPAASRLRVHGQRQDGDSRRLRELLRRRHRQQLDDVEPVAVGGVPADQQRWTARLRRPIR